MQYNNRRVFLLPLWENMDILDIKPHHNSLSTFYSEANRSNRQINDPFKVILQFSGGTASKTQELRSADSIFLTKRVHSNSPNTLCTVNA